MGNLRPGRTICRLKCPRHLTISMTDGQIYCLARRSIFSCIWVVTSDRCLNFNTRGGRISGCCPKRLWAKTVICTAKTFLCRRNCILRMWACRRQRDDLMQSIPIQFKPRHAGILLHQQEEYYWLKHVLRSTECWDQYFQCLHISPLYNRRRRVHTKMPFLLTFKCVQRNE